jgi:hypothetical protein
MTKHQLVLNLIQELQQLSTMDRVNAYGLFKTIRLALSRWINDDVVIYFDSYLEKLDKTILQFNKTEYKIFVNRTVLGELYNLTRLTSSSPNVTKNNTFFDQFFSILNEVTFEIVKAGIDEIYDTDPNILRSGSTLKSLQKLSYETNLSYLLKDILVSYSSLVMNDELKNLQFIRDNTTFMRDTLGSLDQRVTMYIRSKYANVNTNITI